MSTGGGVISKIKVTSFLGTRCRYELHRESKNVCIIIKYVVKGRLFD